MQISQAMFTATAGVIAGILVFGNAYLTWAAGMGNTGEKSTPAATEKPAGKPEKETAKTAEKEQAVKKDKPAETKPAEKQAADKPKSGEQSSDKKATDKKPSEKKTTDKQASRKLKTIKPPPQARFSVESTKASGAAAVADSQACYGEAPKIEQVSPDEAKAGETVTITGKDFGSAGCLVSVSFGPGNPAQFKQASDTSVTATVPSIKKHGLVILTLTTASGEDSKPVLIK